MSNNNNNNANASYGAIISGYRYAMKPLSKRSVIKGETKAQRVSLACVNCRKKKIKCSGQIPCINCLNYKCECIYPNSKPTSSSSQQNKQLPPNILKLIENLQSLDNYESINEQIDSLNKVLISKKDPKPNGIPTTVSKETNYKSQAYLTKFHDSCSDEKIIDDFFGLFCVTSLLSLGGRNWFLTKCSQYDSKYKESILLGSQMAFGSIQKIVMEEMALWEDICSLNDLSKLIDKEIEPIFVNYLVEKHFDSVSNHHYNFESFITRDFINTTQSQLFEKRNAINKSKLLIFLCFLLDACYLEMCLANDEEMANLIRIEKVLLKSCIAYVKVSAFTLLEFDNISGLLYFLKLINNKNATAYYNSLLAHAVNLAQKFGLHRMEYYIGSNEIEADIKRTLFWELYCMDKESFILEGRLIMMLDDEDITTFLPNNVAEIDQALIDESFELSEDNAMSYIRLCEINLCHFACKIYKNLLSKGNAKEELIQEFEELRDSIVIDIRPGFIINVQKFKFSPTQLLRIKELHIKYHSSLLFILTNTRKKATSLSLDLEITCCLDILEILLSINVLDESTINSITKYGLLCSFPLIECFLSVPLHKDSEKIVEMLMKFHLRVSGIARFNSSAWRISNKLLAYILEPIFGIYFKQFNEASFTKELENYQAQTKINESKVLRIQESQHRLEQQRLASDQLSDISMMNGLFTLNQDLGSIAGTPFFERDWRDLFSGI